MHQLKPQPHSDGWAYTVIIGSGIILGLCLLYQSVLFSPQQTLFDTILKISLAGLFIIGSYAAAVQRYKACCLQKMSQRR